MTKSTAPPTTTGAAVVALLLERGFKEYSNPFSKETLETVSQRDFQLRADNDAACNDVPLCTSNNKTFVNVCVYEGEFNRHNMDSVTISLCHANRNDDWVDFKFYGLSFDDVNMNLNDYIQRLIDAFRAVY